MPIMGFPIGYQGAFPIDVEVPGAPSDFDPDAMAWFEAVEAEGANFGPTPEIAAANKTAWSNWVIAQKNAESPITGRSNWQQLTQENQGFIQPMMGLNTFNVPPLFGGRTFTGFVAGDYDPALGLKGGAERVLLANRNWNGTPLNDVAAGVWVTEPGVSSNDRIIGGTSVFFLTDSRVRNRNSSFPGSGESYDVGAYPRSAFTSRDSSAEYLTHNGSLIVHELESSAFNDAQVAFFGTPENTLNADVRGGLAFYGRSINLEAMNTACIALSEAIVWP